MISAAEARKLKDNVCWIQLHQIEQGIKETIIMGGHYLGYRTDMLDKNTIEWLEILGYKVEDDGYNLTKISWED